MSNLKKLAKDLGLKTADSLPPRSPSARRAGPEKPAPDHKAARERWPSDMRLAFAVVAPAAYCIVATDGPVSLTLHNPDGSVARRFGHNRGVWPAEVAKTSNFKDTVTHNYDKFPLAFYGTQVRIWAPTIAMRDAAADDALAVLGAQAEAEGGLAELRRRALDLGPAIDFALLTRGLRERAASLGIKTWVDAELEAWLEDLVRRANEVRAKNGGTFKQTVERLAWKSIEQRG